MESSANLGVMALHCLELPKCLNFENFSLASSLNVNGINTPSSSISSFGSLIMIVNFLA